MKTAQMNVSPMTTVDLEEALNLWSRAPGIGLNESDSIGRLTTYLQRNPSLSLTIRDQGQLVGAVLCGHDGRRGYLHHLAVDSNYRGQGIGTRLIETCVTNLGQLGIMKCNVFVYADNATGTSFWRSRDWIFREDLIIIQRVIDT